MTRTGPIHPRPSGDGECFGAGDAAAATALVVVRSCLVGRTICRPRIIRCMCSPYPLLSSHHALAVAVDELLPRTGCRSSWPRIL